MSSSRQKGNIAPFLLLISLVLFSVVIALLISYMLPHGIESGKYSNPVVATKVIPGTVYDRNGRALSVPVPVYDSTGNASKYSRTYPASFHACHLIQETEKLFSSYLKPIPGYNEQTTYGNDVYLTIDLDIQYVLDLAAQMVYNDQKCQSVVGFIADAQNGEILAMTNYPFFDLNNTVNSVIQNKALVSFLEIGTKKIPTKVISKIEDSKQNVLYSSVNGEYQTFGFTSDLDSTLNLIKSSGSVYKVIPSESNPKFVLFIGAQGSKNPNVKTEIVNQIVDALSKT